MRKLAVSLALVAASFALVASTAEAAKTSEKEGRKWTTSWIKNHGPDLGWKIRDCWRIGQDGAGYYNVFPGGIVCRFSSTKGRACSIVSVATQDGRRGFKISISDRVRPYDPAYCDRVAGTPEPPAPDGAIRDPL